MSKFKIGDKVTMGEGFTITGKVVTIHRLTTYMGEDCFQSDDVVYDDFNYPLSRAVLHDPEGAAIRLLEEAGWTKSKDGSLSPPKPKLTGTVDICKASTNGQINAFPIGSRAYRHPTWITIATIDWTEGDGLEPRTEA